MSEKTERLAMVRGHLEGYADMVEALARVHPDRPASEVDALLTEALREDAETLAALQQNGQNVAIRHDSSECVRCKGTGEDIEAPLVGDLPLPPCPLCQQVQPDGGEREASGIGAIDCPNCDGCGWNEGSPASTCQLCGGSGHVCGTCNGRLTADEYEFNDETRKLERIVLGPCPACALADHQPSKEGEADRG